MALAPFEMVWDMHPHVKADPRSSAASAVSLTQREDPSERAVLCLRFGWVVMLVEEARGEDCLAGLLSLGHLDFRDAWNTRCFWDRSADVKT